MKESTSYYIDIKALAKSSESIILELNDDFFKSLDQEEITTGTLTTTLQIKESAGEIFNVELTILGKVQVLCDRCLDPLWIPIHTNYKFKLTDSIVDFPIDLDIKQVTSLNSKYDIKWDLYEIILLSLPLEKKHNDSQCDSDMMNRFSIQEKI